MTSSVKPRTYWKLVIICAVIVCLLVISIPICNRVLFPEFPEPYEGPSSTPREVHYDIERINATIRLRCPNPGLSDATWVCPQVTQDQARLIIARQMTKHIEYHDVTLQEQQRYTQGSREEMTRVIHNHIIAMGYRQCLIDNHVSLMSGILTELERGNFLERCVKGWNLTQPWLEIIERQAPLPPPNWQDYKHKLDPEFVP